MYVFKQLMEFRCDFERFEFCSDHIVCSIIIIIIIIITSVSGIFCSLRLPVSSTLLLHSMFH